MARPHAGLLAGPAQQFDRERARRLEQAVARRRVVVAAVEHHERSIDQHAQRVERRPLVERIVHRDASHQLQRGAADDDAQASEHDLLACVEQAVAPFERSAQRAVAAGSVARAAGQQPQALAERRRQALDAEQRHARCSQPDAPAAGRRAGGTPTTAVADVAVVEREAPVSRRARSANSATAP